MSFCLSMSLTLTKLVPSLIGSEHAIIRYIIQLLLMGSILKRKQINFFKNEASVLKLLIARGKVYFILISLIIVIQQTIFSRFFDSDYSYTWTLRRKANKSI